MEYKYNSDTNTVTAIMHPNEILGNTKSTWTLSEDRLTYSKIFGYNIHYSTPVHDIWGNEASINLNITRSRRQRTKNKS